MSNESNNSIKLRGLSSDNCLLVLKRLNSTPTESWQEGEFAYNFFRLGGDRVNVQTSCFLKATNLMNDRVRAVQIPSSISTGKEALDWAVSV